MIERGLSLPQSCLRDVESMQWPNSNVQLNMHGVRAAVSILMFAILAHAGDLVNSWCLKLL